MKLPSYGLPFKLCQWSSNFLFGRGIQVLLTEFGTCSNSLPNHINDLLFTKALWMEPHSTFSFNEPVSKLNIHWQAVSAILVKDLIWETRNFIKFNASMVWLWIPMILIWHGRVVDLTGCWKWAWISVLFTLYYRYFHGFCSSELSSIIPQLVKPARRFVNIDESPQVHYQTTPSRTIRFHRLSHFFPIAMKITWIVRSWLVFVLLAI